MLINHMAQGNKWKQNRNYSYGHTTTPMIPTTITTTMPVTVVIIFVVIDIVVVIIVVVVVNPVLQEAKSFRQS